MNETTTLPAQPAIPVMDVVTPRAAEPAAAAPTNSSPVSDASTSEIPQPSPAPTHQKPAVQKPVKLPKESSGGVSLAIFATVMIVLGLASLFVIAYLKTNNSI